MLTHPPAHTHVRSHAAPGVPYDKRLSGLQLPKLIIGDGNAEFTWEKTEKTDKRCRSLWAMAFDKKCKSSGDPLPIELGSDSTGKRHAAFMQAVFLRSIACDPGCGHGPNQDKSHWAYAKDTTLRQICGTVLCKKDRCALPVAFDWIKQRGLWSLIESSLVNHTTTNNWNSVLNKLKGLCGMDVKENFAGSSKQDTFSKNDMCDTPSASLVCVRPADPCAQVQPVWHRRYVLCTNPR
jgi:hypothetical protein